MVLLQSGQLLLQNGDFSRDAFLLLEVVFEVVGHLADVLRGQFGDGPGAFRHHFLRS